MSRFTISKFEVKPPIATGKIKAVTSLIDEQGKETPNVGIWSDFPGFVDLKANGSVEGEIKLSPDGKWKNLSPMTSAPKWATAKGGAGGIKAAQERKAEDIKQAQVRKNESIAYFNAVNSAIALYNGTPEKKGMPIKEFIVEWRDWFLSEWEKYDAGDITTKSQPF